MSTLYQLIKNTRKLKKKKKRTIALEQAPQKKGICLRIFIQTPRKPNSALRKVARIKLSNFKIITAFIPGEGHSLQQHSNVLVRGGRVKDLPGMKYKIIRGKYDLSGLTSRRKRRSLYGTPKQKIKQT
jgi:small subunit ribosomal protein S12